MKKANTFYSSPGKGGEKGKGMSNANKAYMSPGTKSQKKSGKRSMNKWMKGGTTSTKTCGKM